MTLVGTAKEINAQIKVIEERNEDLSWNTCPHEGRFDVHIYGDREPVSSHEIVELRDTEAREKALREQGLNFTVYMDEGNGYCEPHSNGAFWQTPVHYNFSGPGFPNLGGSTDSAVSRDYRPVLFVIDKKQ